MSEPNPITVGTYVYSPDTRFSVSRDHTSTHWDLKIRNVQLEDAGVYFCAVSSGEGREKHRRLIKLNVKGLYCSFQLNDMNGGGGGSDDQFKTIAHVTFFYFVEPLLR